MSWRQAEQVIMRTIAQGLALEPMSRYGRKVVLVPPSKPLKGIFKGLEGYNVQIGKSKFIWVPMLMLENLYNSALANNNVYSKDIFDGLYPGLAGPNATPCYIHVIGKIFEICGLAVRTGRSQYQIT